MENTTNASGATQNSGFNMESLTGMLNNAQVPEKLKQYGQMAANKVNSLSTTQKVIGGALLVLGAGYLSSRSKVNSKLNLGALANKLKR